MSTTRTALRQAIGYELSEMHAGTVTSATTTTLTDSALVDADESASRWDRAWLYVTSGAQVGVVRRVSVSGFAPTTGALTLSRAWTAPAPGDTYELHQMLAPEDLHRLIDIGLQRCTYLAEQAITPVSGNRNYDLSAYTWLTEPSQVQAIVWRQGTVANQYRYLPDSWWEVRRDGATLTLDIEPYSVAASDQMYLRCIRPYAALTSDTDSTACPLEWAKAAAIVSIYEWISRNDPGQDATRYQKWAGIAAAKLVDLTRKHAPRPRVRVMLPDGVHRGYSSDLVS